MKNDLVARYIQPLDPLPGSLPPGGKLTAPIHSVLFDVYGTLLISRSGDIGIAKRESQRRDRLKDLLLRYKISAPVEAMLKVFYSAIEQEHHRLRKKGVDFPEVKIDRIWMQVLETHDLEMIREFAVEFELIVNPIYPMPNLKQTLDVCKASGVRMGIISNAQFYTPYLFERLLGSTLKALGFHPELTLYSYIFGYAKPSIFLFRGAVERLKQLDVVPSSTLYVGNDMLNDIYPAQQVGFQTALFAGDARSLRLRNEHPKCQDLAADLVITDLLQLLPHFNQPESAL